MKTTTDIKCGLRARVEGLEMMLDMYEKDNPLRHNLMIRIDECNRLIRILTVLEVEKDGEQNDRNGMSIHCRGCSYCGDCFDSSNNSMGKGKKQ